MKKALLAAFLLALFTSPVTYAAPFAAKQIDGVDAASRNDAKLQKKCAALIQKKKKAEANAEKASEKNAKKAEKKVQSLAKKYAKQCGTG